MARLAREDTYTIPRTVPSTKHSEVLVVVSIRIPSKHFADSSRQMGLAWIVPLVGSSDCQQGSLQQLSPAESHGTLAACLLLEGKCLRFSGALGMWHSPAHFSSAVLEGRGGGGLERKGVKDFYLK